MQYEFHAPITHSEADQLAQFYIFELRLKHDQITALFHLSEARDAAERTLRDLRMNNWRQQIQPLEVCTQESA